jgi:hypothetical protein
MTGIPYNILGMKIIIVITVLHQVCPKVKESLQYRCGFYITYGYLTKVL